MRFSVARATNSAGTPRDVIVKLNETIRKASTDGDVTSVATASLAGQRAVAFANAAGVTIAMPAMTDPHFARTLTFICEHNEQGALGVVVNRPIDMTLQTLLKQIEIECQSGKPAETPIHYGGPVQIDRGFVLHSPAGSWNSTLVVNENIGLTTSKDILEAVACGEGPQSMLVTLGYAGWGEGQLDGEMKRHGWMPVEGDDALLFDTVAEERWTKGFAADGVDARLLSPEAGHA